MSDLKHCPFCGSEAVMCEAKFGYEQFSRYTVQCKNKKCGIVAPQWYESQEEAQAAWNRRVPVEEVDA